MYVCFKHERRCNNPHRNFILKADKVKPQDSQMDHKQNELPRHRFLKKEKKIHFIGWKVDFNNDKKTDK